MSKYIYIRVSTGHQDYERQYQAFKNKGIDLNNYDIIEETYSGAKLATREKLLNLLDKVTKGDTIVVESLSRLARSTKDLLYITELLDNKGVTLESLKEQIDTSTPVGKLFITVIGAVNQFERDVTAERTREALQAKKAKGIQLGRPVELDHQAMISYYHSDKEVTQSDVARKFNTNQGHVSRTFRKLGVTKNSSNQAYS